ncbi:MAG: hypothetical protein PHO66_06410, partial [Eubacteriales bacterium]|nr:hypothetical protein [Eubacteriales bacterium]
MDNPDMRRRMMAVNGDLDRTGTLEDPLFQARSIVAQGKPAPRIYHACGTEDFVLESARYTRDFFEAFEGDPFDYTYEEYPGIHEWAFWDDHIQDFLKFINLPRVTGLHN